MPAPTSEDDLKRRARRRLIGAVALTLAAVIILPLLLEDEPPPTERLEVQMPPIAEQPKPMDTVPPPAVTPPAETPAVVAAPEIAPPVEAAPKPEVLNVPKPKPSPVPTEPVKTGSKPAPPTEADPPRDSSPSPEASTPAFVVQLGAFSDPAKATLLKNRAAELGLPTYTDKSGALTRLRVGPFTSREAAIDAAVKLAEVGMNGQVMPK